MKHHPMLFSTEMVEAILANRKTMTRRIVTNRNSFYWVYFKELDLNNIIYNNPFGFIAYQKTNPELSGNVLPKWDVDDILWVREKFTTETYNGLPYAYYAGNIEVQNNTAYRNLTKWKPSIHMPREACRIFLKVKSVKAEYLHDITINDAEKEGLIRADAIGSHVTAFEEVWDNNNSQGSWDSNPLVWAIEFERVEL